jgi:hypothetical protein
MRIPLGGRIPNMTTDHPMGFEIFWRDVDKIADDPEGKDVGAGGGDISWASWGQSTTVDCGNPTTSLFHTANWGHLVFDKTDPLGLVDKPNIASVSVAGGNLTLTWTGGAGPFKVQRRDDIATGAWADVTTTNDRTASVPRTGNAGFLRVVGQ